MTPCPRHRGGQRRAIHRPRQPFAALLAAALLFSLAHPASAALSETQVKAAYLYKLASFVRWPPVAFADPAAPLRICVAGRADIADLVANLARGQQAAGRHLAAETVDLTRPDATVRCQILYLGNEASARALAATIAHQPVLTVTDRTGGSRGGVIEFVLNDGSVRFAIHRQQAEARQLALSSKLLAVAQVVEQ